MNTPSKTPVAQTEIGKTPVAQTDSIEAILQRARKAMDDLNEAQKEQDRK